MAEKKIVIDVEINGGESIANIKKSIKELRSQALAVGEGGAGFKKLTQEANQLQDKLDDLKDSSKSLQGTGIEKLKSSFGLLTESFKNADFGKAKTAFTGLGSAMKAIPIFLIIEGIQYLVENFEKLSQGSGFLAKALQFVGSIITKVTEGITWLLDKLGLVNAELDKQSENLAKNAEKGKAAIDKQNTAYDQQIAILKANGKSTIELEVAKQDAIIATNKALVQQTIDFVRSGGELNKAQKETLDAQLAAIKQASVDKEVIIATAETASNEKRKKANAEYAANKAKADEKAAKDELDAWNKTVEIRMSNTAAQEKQAEQDRKDAADKKIADEKAMLDAITQSNIEAMAEEKAIYDASEEGKTAKAKAEQDKRKEDREKDKNERYAKFKEDVEETNKYTQAIGAALTAVVGVFTAISDLQRQQGEQDSRERQEKLDIDISNLEAAKEIELLKEGLSNDQKIAINNKFALQEYALKVDEYNKGTEIKKKAFEQDKKLRIAQVVINTITGAVAALTSSIQAFGIPYGAIIGALAAAAVTATGVIQVDAINKQKFDAGTPPAAPKLQMPSGAESMQQGSQQGPDLYSIGGDSNNGQGGQGFRKSNNSGGEPIRAYVVTEDITGSQNKNAVIERRSSF